MSSNVNRSDCVNHSGAFLPLSQTYYIRPVQRLVWGVIAVVLLSFGISCDNPAELRDEDLEGVGQAGITITTTQTIDGSGGTVEDPSGAAVIIPAGALSESTEIQIGTYQSIPLPDEVELAGELYFFGPEGLDFAVPVEVVVPYTSALLSDEISELELALLVFREEKWERVLNYRFSEEEEALIGETERFSAFGAGIPLMVGPLRYRLHVGTSDLFDGHGALTGTALVTPEGHFDRSAPTGLPRLRHGDDADMDCGGLIQDYLTLGPRELFVSELHDSGHSAKATVRTGVYPRGSVSIGINLTAEAPAVSRAISTATAMTGLPQFMGLAYFPIPAFYVIDIEDYESTPSDPYRDIAFRFTNRSNNTGTGDTSIMVATRHHECTLGPDGATFLSDDQEWMIWYEGAVPEDDLFVWPGFGGRKSTESPYEVTYMRWQIEMMIFGITNATAMLDPDHSGRAEGEWSILITDTEEGKLGAPHRPGYFIDSVSTEVLVQERIPEFLNRHSIPLGQQ